MNAATNAAANIAANAAINAARVRNRVVEHFQKAGALTADTAIALPPKSPRHTVDALIKHKVIVPVGEGLFYLDLEANARSNRDQAKAGIAVVIGLVIVLAIVIGALAIARQFAVS